MESFGFESELEPQEGNVPSRGGSGFRQDSGEECDSKVGVGTGRKDEELGLAPRGLPRFSGTLCD